jgi:hypothetical protein
MTKNHGSEITKLRNALRDAISVIEDYLSYEHNGDPWVEDARLMGEMEINEYAKNGGLAEAKDLLKEEE